MSSVKLYLRDWLSMVVSKKLLFSPLDCVYHIDITKQMSHLYEKQDGCQHGCQQDASADNQFQAQFERILQVTGAKNPSQLGKILGFLVPIVRKHGQNNPK